MASERVRVAALATWVGQQVAALKATAGYATTVATSATGTATVTFPAGRFATAPVVSAVAVSTSATQPTVVEVVSVSATAVTVETWRTQATVLALGITLQPAVAVAATVHITARAAS